MLNRRITKEISYLENYRDIVNNRYTYSTKKKKKKSSIYQKYEKILKNLASQSIKITNIIGNSERISLDIYIKSYKFNFVLDLHGYPFKCPYIKLNGKNYQLCLPIKSSNYFNMGSSCLCCLSITCGNKWRGTYTIIDILNEYIEFDKLYFSRIRDRYNCKKYICVKKLGFYLPIADFL